MCYSKIKKGGETMVDEVIQIVSSLGFPIAAYVGLFWYMVTQRKTHKEETEALTKTIENNTLTLQKLVDKLSEGGDSIDTKM